MDYYAGQSEELAAAGRSQTTDQDGAQAQQY
jgi:hypothetical protein